MKLLTREREKAKLKFTCITSSSILGDVTPSTPVFCLKTGGMNTQGQFYKQQGSRGRGRGRGKVCRTRTEVTVHPELDDELHLKQRHTLAMSSQEETSNRVSSLDSSSFLPSLGVGRRTSILFKKAKNGAKLTESMLFSLQSTVSADQSSEKLPDLRSQPSLVCSPTTPKSHKRKNGMETFLLSFRNKSVGHTGLNVKVMRTRADCPSGSPLLSSKVKKHVFLLSLGHYIFSLF